MRRDSKIDANQREIVAVARGCGALVYHTHMVGQGFPDLVIGYRGIVLLVEVKNPAGWKLTGPEQVFHEEWGEMVHIVEEADDMVELLNQTRMRSWNTDRALDIVRGQADWARERATIK